MLRRGSVGLAFALACVAGCARTPSVPPPAAPTVHVAPPPPVAVPAPPKPEPLRIEPATVNLAPGDPGVQLRAEDGENRRDVTARVAWSLEPDGAAALDPSGYVRPLRPGAVTVRARLDGRKAAATININATEARAWDFGQDVVPILTRAGCNTGACHGKADGQNGFHLSLFGYDPDGDHQALTRDGGGRRISPVAPDESLVWLKATGRVAHGGGLRLAPGSTDARVLLDWLAAGAPARLGTTHGPLKALAVEPANSRLDAPGPIQLRVVARYEDGHERDVTRLASYRVNDDSAATVDALGSAVLLRRAETDLIVRYQSRVVSTRLGAVINPGLAFDFAKVPRRNFIDDELLRRLEALKVPPSPPATDAAFLRRVSLDLTGEQPTPEQIRRFLADTDPDKRVKLVDELVASGAFVKFWRIKFGDLLQVTSARFGNGASYYQTWIDERLAANTPLDQWVRTLLTALGEPMSYGGGPVNYALDGPDPQTSAEQTAQRFLALRLRCAQCHDHPFDIWTQDDYFGLAACFAKVQRGGGNGAMMGKTVVKLDPAGKVEHLRTKRPAAPRLLDGTLVQAGDADDPRKALADWITAPENPYFARALANWAWAQFFGKGLADPPDDLSRANPPVHPELLDALARHFVARKFDLRDLVRTIATSEAYGLSSAAIAGNEHDTRFFSHQVPRPLTAHQMADALAQATDVVNRYPNRPAGTRAIEVADPATASTILETFGRCPRTNGCASVSTASLSLRQALLLIGGDVIEGKVSHLNGYLANLLDLNPEPAEIVENLYLRTLCRPATTEEVARWSAELKQAASLREASEDLFWALLNSREFAFNH